LTPANQASVWHSHPKFLAHCYGVDPAWNDNGQFICLHLDFGPKDQFVLVLTESDGRYLHRELTEVLEALGQ
jgi:hypothetical protein